MLLTTSLVTSTGLASSTSSGLVLCPGLFVHDFLFEPLLKLGCLSLGHLKIGRKFRAADEAGTRLAPVVIGDDGRPISCGKSKARLPRTRAVLQDCWDAAWTFHSAGATSDNVVMPTGELLCCNGVSKSAAYFPLDGPLLTTKIGPTFLPVPVTEDDEGDVRVVCIICR